MTKEEFIYAIENDQSISDEERASLLEEISTLSEEQLDEISNKTLGSYVRKSADDLAYKAYVKGQKEAQVSSLRAVTATIRNNQTSDLEKKLGLDYKTVSKEEDKIHKRMRGIDRATNRLSREQVENLKGNDEMTVRSNNPEEQQLDELMTPSKLKDIAAFHSKRLKQVETQNKNARKKSDKLFLDDYPTEKAEDKAQAKADALLGKVERADDEPEFRSEYHKGQRDRAKGMLKYYNRYHKKMYESAASDSLSPSYNKDFNSDPTTRLDTMMAIFGHVATLPAQDMLEFYNKMIAQVGHEADAIPPGTAEKNKASIKASIKEEAKSELVAAFGSDETLTEEFKTSAQTIFEAAVNAQVVLEVEEIKSALDTESTELFEAVLNDFEDKLDAYVEYAVTSWLEENAVPIESNLRTSITEEFIGKLHQLFTESYFEVPSEKLDVVEMMAEKIAEMEDRMNDLVTENSRLSETVDEHTKNSVFDAVSEGLSLTQVDKFKTLTENLDFVNAEDYHKKLQTIRESFKLSDKKTTPSIITEDSKVLIDEEVDEKVARIDPTVEAYMKAIKK